MAGLGFRTKFGYGVGHVLNDLCSAMWFTYLLIYFHFVLLFNNSLAGVVLLIGQVADALSTPFVGNEADRTDDLACCKRYGRRKSWHLTGTICVLGAFPFIFIGCLGCSDASDWAQVIYFAPFVIVFQFGWASTQISHLSLIPSITQDTNDRTELNAIRYGFTVMSNITVYLITWLVMGLDSTSTNSSVGPEDAYKFRIIVFTILAIGAAFSMLFHFLVKEENTPQYARMPDAVSIINKEAGGETSSLCENDVPEVERSASGRTLVRASDWLKNVQFYQVAVLYMCTRLFCNLSQAYVPIYLQDTLKLPEEAVAYIPLVMYVSGFLTTTIMRLLNKFIGRKASFIVGSVLGGSSTICVWFGEGELYSKYLLYGVAALMGAGASIMLVTSLSITADLIGPCVESGAFVYGAMSFTDKLSNGIAVMLIQTYNPCSGSPFGDCCPLCAPYFREVLFYWCGGAALVSFLALLTLLPAKIGNHPSISLSGREPSENHLAGTSGNAIVIPDEHSVGILAASENNSSADEKPTASPEAHVVAAEYHEDLRARVISLASDSDERESNA